MGTASLRCFGLSLALLGLACGMGAEEELGSRDPSAYTWNSRGVSGTVYDRDGRPLAGAVVQLKEQATLRIRSYVAHQGRYSFFGLCPEFDYTLKAHYGGLWSSTKWLSRFDSRKEAIVDLKVNVSAPPLPDSGPVVDGGPLAESPDGLDAEP